MNIQWRLQMPQQTTESESKLSATPALRAGDQLTAAVLNVSRGSDALLAFGSSKAYARLPLPVVSGQDIQIRIESTDPQLRMVMLPSGGQASNLPSGQRLAISLFEPISEKPFLATHARSLKPGQSLLGRITGFEKSGMKLVDFGKFKAFVQIDVPVRQGQTIPLTVMKNDHSGVALTMSSQGRSSASTGLGPSDAARAAPRTRAGVMQIQARPMPNPMQTDVLASPAMDRSMGGSSMSPAPTAADMAVLRDQVQHLFAGTILPGTDTSAALPTPMTEALKNIQQILTPASTLGDMGALVDRVRDFVENSGLYFEKRLEQAIAHLQNRTQAMPSTELSAQPAIRELMIKDLKPNLLILKQFLDAQSMELKAADRHVLETLKSVVQRAVSHIEQQQAAAAEKPVDPDLFQSFSHLLFLTDQQRNARLKIYYAKKGRQDDHKNPRVSLLLEMDRMGLVRTDLWKLDKELNITFFVQNAEIKAAIDNEQHRIGVLLKTVFNTVAVSVVVNEKKITEFDGEDLTVSNHRQLDLSV